MRRKGSYKRFKIEMTYRKGRAETSAAFDISLFNHTKVFQGIPDAADRIEGTEAQHHAVLSS